MGEDTGKEIKDTRIDDFWPEGDKSKDSLTIDDLWTEEDKIILKSMGKKESTCADYWEEYLENFHHMGGY